ncbi:Succinyl-CoA synthetase subunit beta [Sulfitobacter noctilucicola]|uniref:Uncharacterized protein n=1 Tax=Sulfitobacter noctilucicola TaxID=1342301 RepID=A0A7W6Q6H8_9RHOB|nr:hypothetical protein [Sulfitobacter noctilucicola]KIN63670.1 Succinyl-CoA synthetase subunit beta [Sulfitobacter noctilucicola]MBB4174820.1 hypothetical protein [Sulfitobacter noctilucicola]
MRLAASLYAFSLLAVGSTATAGGPASTARAAMQLFADNCFSPYLTADKAAKTFALSGASYDFYDLDPFSSVAASPATARAVTPGTDRRCEVSFAGDYSETAAQAVLKGLSAEAILDPAPLPARYASGDSTTLLAARRLNPRRVAVVHVGTRPASGGIETFMLVERLTPSDSAD